MADFDKLTRELGALRDQLALVQKMNADNAKMRAEYMKERDIARRDLDAALLQNQELRKALMRIDAMRKRLPDPDCNEQANTAAGIAEIIQVALAEKQNSETCGIMQYKPPTPCGLPLPCAIHDLEPDPSVQKRIEPNPKPDGKVVIRPCPSCGFFHGATGCPRAER